jgi:hypothetical protein
VIAFVGQLVAKIPSRFRPAFLDSIVDAGEAAQARIAERAAKTVAPTTATFAREMTTAAAANPARGGLAGVLLGAAAAGAALPAVAELRVRGQISDAEIDAIVARGVQLSDSRPIHTHVTIAVDGEPLARATARANRTAAARAFYPVTVEEPWRSRSQPRRQRACRSSMCAAIRRCGQDRAPGQRDGARDRRSAEVEHEIGELAPRSGA